MEKQYRSADKQSNTSTMAMVVTGVNNVTSGTDKHYKGVLHPDSLLWCHGSIGLEHVKKRKFRYPFYKYSHTEDASIYRIVICVCENCNMTFYGADALDTPLSIPVKYLDSYQGYELQVRVNGTMQSLRGDIVTPFRQATQEELTDETREFIDKVR